MTVIGRVQNTGKGTWIVGSTKFKCSAVVNIFITKQLKKWQAGGYKVNCWIRDSDSELLSVRVK